MAWQISERSGKVFIDHNMNRSGANISAAYSLRPELRAPVSTPLTWDEVFEGGFEPQDFRMDNVWERFARVGDLFAWSCIAIVVTTLIGAIARWDRATR